MYFGKPFNCKYKEPGSLVNGDSMPELVRENALLSYLLAYLHNRCSYTSLLWTCVSFCVVSLSDNV